MAGESAGEVARRQREKIERLERSAAAWERGAEGERATARALAMLPASDWTVKHDVRWPGRRLANIDHVVVGPGGVFVIDSKNWSGVVEVRDGVLRQNGYRREKDVASVADSALAVAEAVPGLDPRLVRPVLCLVGDQPLATYSHEVLVCSTATLVEQLQSQPAVMDARTAGRVFGHVTRTLSSATGTRHQPRPLRRQSAPPPPGPPSALGPRPSRVGRALRWTVALVALGLAAIVLLSILGALFRAVTTIGQDIARGGAPGTGATQGVPALGEAQRLPRATNRPPLLVTPDKFVTTTVVGDGPLLYDGNRFVAVRVTIKNDGKRTWRSQPGTEWVLLGDLGSRARSLGAVRTKAGRPLGDVITVAPGRRLSGWLVFQVDLQRPVTGLVLTVGPGQPAEASWSIDRQ